MMNIEVTSTEFEYPNSIIWGSPQAPNLQNLKGEPCENVTNNLKFM